MYIIEKHGNHTRISVVAPTSPAEFIPHLFHQTRSRLRELWNFRELILNLVVRDLKVRYKNSVLGVFWSLLNPLLMMVVYTAVFTVMRGQAVNKYPAFVLVGLLPWQFFVNAIMSSTASIVGNAHLINKVYFPKEALVIATVLSNLVNFLIGLLVLIPILLLFKIRFSGWIMLLPVMILVQMLFTLGIGLITATANVFYRDVQMIMDVVLMAGFFMTPVFYSLDILPHSYMLGGVNLDIWRLMYYFNPMASIIANYRVIIFDGSPPALDFLIRTFLTALVFLAIGLAIFYRYQGRFSEEV